VTREIGQKGVPADNMTSNCRGIRFCGRYTTLATPVKKWIEETLNAHFTRNSSLDFQFGEPVEENTKLLHSTSQ